MHNSTKTTTFSVKKGHTYTTHMHNNTKTTTFSVKKGHTCTTALKQQHLV